MFCPTCGSEDRQANQFCRSCGADLRPVHLAVSRPDRITESAASARDEIGRAVAAKIRETRDADELAKVTEEVLPEIEKFLESPEERRLRRMRVGMTLSSIGAGVVVGLSVAALLAGERDIFFMAGLGVVVFFLGLGFILNGFFLTVPKRSLPTETGVAGTDQQVLPGAVPADVQLPQAPADVLFPSVIEHTTQHLKEMRDPAE